MSGCADVMPAAPGAAGGQPDGESPNRAKTVPGPIPAAPAQPQPSVKRQSFTRSKSCPASDLTARLAAGVHRHDSVQSSQSNTSGGGATSSLCGRDSGLGSELGTDGSSSCRKCLQQKHQQQCQLNGSGGGVGQIKVDCNGDKVATIRLHYYPEGGWGWVICVCAFVVEIVSHGLHSAYGIFYLEVLRKFGQDKWLEAGCLGAMSMAVSLLMCPIVVALCRRKSVRITAVMGGLVAALGLLFTSFATQFHQLFVSYGAVVAFGVCVCRTTAGLMLGQYFKRRREAVEVAIQGSVGLGLIVTSIVYKLTISDMGWRPGLQVLTGVTFSTFFMGILYRSASLYHPQRRAILHLKNQKRKIKDKKGRGVEDKPPFFDFTTLKSRTVQILIASAALSSFGIHSPIIFLAYEAHSEGLDDQSVLLVQAFVGVAIVLGSSAFGLITVKDSAECRIARHYLCQAAGLVMSIALICLAGVHRRQGFLFFAWVYGAFYGGYAYALKMFVYEKVRARNFARTWSFLQWAQALPLLVGTPVTGYLNAQYARKYGFHFSAVCAIAGAFVLVLIDVHRRTLGQHKARHSTTSRGGHRGTSKSGRSVVAAIGDGSTPERSSKTKRRRRSSLPSAEDDDNDEEEAAIGVTTLAILAGQDFRQPELLTCISEEGFADIPDHLLEEFLALGGDCMTSCDQVEHYLMLSEYENNLNKTNEVESGSLRMESRRRKSSVVMAAAAAAAGLLGPIRSEDSNGGDQSGPVVALANSAAGRKVSLTRTNGPSRQPSRSITVIDETASSL